VGSILWPSPIQDYLFDHSIWTGDKPIVKLLPAQKDTVRAGYELAIQVLTLTTFRLLLSSHMPRYSRQEFVFLFRSFFLFVISCFFPFILFFFLSFIFTVELYSRCSSVNTVTSLRAGRPWFDSWQGQWRNIFSSPPRPYRHWGPPNLLPAGCRELFPRGGQSGRVVNLTVHLHLLLRLTIHGVIPPLPHTSSWHGAGTTLSFTLSTVWVWELCCLLI
jgi:hypothetical protein